MKVTLAKGQFASLPEGHYTFTIVAVSGEDTFKKIEVKSRTEEGDYQTETYHLLKNNGQPNDGANQAFSAFVHRVMDDNWASEDIELDDLVGRRFEADIEIKAVPSTKEPGKVYKNARYANIEALGLDEEVAAAWAAASAPQPEAETEPAQPAEDEDDDLDAMLADL